MISQDSIAKVRDAANIVDVISDFLQLKRQGNTYRGSCPFHQETKPSFTVHPEKQIFHCFGCGEGGNVFSFIMKMNNMQFPEAVEFLAQRYSIPLEKSSSDENHRPDISAKQYEINEFAAEYFNRQLFKTKEGKRVTEYIKSRNIDDAVVKEFRLGFAQNSWDGLVSAAHKCSYEIDLLLSSGLAVRHEKKNSVYDRFRNRLIFPIVNEFGKIAGFGGRILPGDDSPAKYINSPESPVYQKSKILYGLFQGKEAIRKKGYSILVEGYTDVITLHQNNFKNAVASSGTALTEQQGRILQRYAPRVIMLYDSDEAGRKATFRGAEILLETGLDVFAAFLEKGEDPDSFFKNHSEEDFQSLMDNSVPFIEYYIDLITKAKKNASLPEIIRESTSLLSSVSKISNKIQRDMYTGQIAECLGVSVSAVMDELKKQQRSYGKKEDGDSQKNRGELLNISHSLDADILKTALLDPEARNVIFTGISLDDISIKPVRSILSELKKTIEEKKEIDPAELIDRLSAPMQKQLLALIIDENERYRISIEPEEFAKEIIQKANQLINRIMLRSVENELEQVNREWKLRKQKNKPDEDLKSRFLELTQKKVQLNHL